MQDGTPSVWAIGVLVLATPVAVVLSFRTMTAKTRKAFFVNFALGMAVVQVILIAVSVAGLGPTPEELRHAQSKAPKPGDLLKATPWEVIAAVGLWIIGGNVIILRQRRKAGETWRRAFNPFAPVARYMDRGAWLQLLLLVFISLAVAQVGLVRTAAQQPAGTPAATPQH